MPDEYVFFSLETLFGYLTSILMGHIVIRPTMKRVFKKTGLQQHLDSIGLAGWVGIFERLIYTTAIIVDGKEIIAAWLALKAIAEFKSPDRELIGYYSFLLGNGLSLFFGIGGGILAQQLNL